MIANGTDILDELMEEGERLIAKGLPVIPCNAKCPSDYRGLPCNDWQKLPATLERLRIGLRAAADPGIGLIMGKRSGMIDMEVDDDDDEIKARDHVWRGVERPVTPAFVSKRGRHDLYAYDPRLAAIDKEVLEYSDDQGNKFKIRLGVNAGGAQSIIPPTSPRAWIDGLSLDDCNAATLPDIIVERMLACSAAKRKKSTRSAAGGVHSTALDAINRCCAKMVDGEDGSKRLFAAACRCVELNLTDGEAVATVRAYEGEKPFPRAWSDDEILARVRDAEQTVERGSEVVISNFSEIEVETPGLLSDGSAGDAGTKIVTVPKSMGEITGAIFENSGGWPKRVDNMLFVDDPAHGMSYFDRRTTAGVFGWLRGKFKVDWAKGGRYAAQSEVFAELERTADRFDAVEVLPHEPTIAGIYYRGRRPQPGDGRRLRWLLNRFRPATTIDRDLIQAAIMTPLWGGAAGRRPAFVFTSDDGRGAGKTTVCEMIGRLYGGIIDVSAGEDIQTLKTRLLSPNSRTCRIGLIDNVKTMRLSWAELEALITSPVISGRQLFVGEGQRPNLLPWFLSLNGVSMATDMAQRSVIIKVVKGENAGDWHDVTTRYIDEHREQLIGDVIGALRGDRFPLANYSRWSTWESEVLCRLPEPGEAQKLILERQGEANTEIDEAEIIESYFADQLASFRYEPNTAQVRIPVATAAYWFSKAIGEPIKTAAASKRIHQMSTEGQLKRIAPDKCSTISFSNAAEPRPIGNALKRSWRQSAPNWSLR